MRPTGRRRGERVGEFRRRGWLTCGGCGREGSGCGTGRRPRRRRRGSGRTGRRGKRARGSGSGGPPSPRPPEMSPEPGGVSVAQSNCVFFSSFHTVGWEGHGLMMAYLILFVSSFSCLVAMSIPMRKKCQCFHCTQARNFFYCSPKKICLDIWCR